MLYLTCTIISSVDFAHCGVSRAKDWVSLWIVIQSILANSEQYLYPLYIYIPVLLNFGTKF